MTKSHKSKMIPCKLCGASHIVAEYTISLTACWKCVISTMYGPVISIKEESPVIKAE